MRKVNGEKRIVKSEGELSVDERKLAVSRLSSEGLSSSEIGEELGISARTVRRDREAVRKELAMSRGEKLVEEQVGGMVMQCQRAIARLRRIANEKESPAAARVDAEWKAWLVCERLAVRLQSMGYLPDAAREARTGVTHKTQREHTAAELNERVVQFEKIVREAGRMDEEAEKRIGALKALVAMKMEEERSRGILSGSPATGG